MIINRDCSVEGAHWRVFPPARIFWIPRHTGSPRTAMRGPVAWVTPHYDAGSREERRGIHLPVFLDTAS